MSSAADGARDDEKENAPLRLTVSPRDPKKVSDHQAEIYECRRNAVDPHLPPLIRAIYGLLGRLLETHDSGALLLDRWPEFLTLYETAFGQEFE